MIINHNFGIRFFDDLSFELVIGSQNVGFGYFCIKSRRKDLLHGKSCLMQISGAKKIDGEFGQCNNWTIKWHNQCTENQIQLLLNVYSYSRWADTLIFEFKITNLGENTFTFDQWEIPSIELGDIFSINGSGISTWAMQGAGVNWGQDFAFPLIKGSKRNNFLGHLDGAEGGGIPVNYIWNTQLGFALSHIEPKPKDWYMPVNVLKKNGSIRLALQERRIYNLQKGQIISGLSTMLSIHRGDFYAALALYREVMSAQNISAPKANFEDYEPAWCSWGYEFDVRPEELYGVLPRLNDLGIRWLTLDDRWFDNYGDWNPRQDTFPGGVKQIQQVVNEIHHAGAMAQLWWYPLAVEDGNYGWESHQYQISNTYLTHPEWVCLTINGKVARNNRKLAILCPALPDVQEYIADLTHKFIHEWDFDGHKLDNIYTIPACYNPAHQHKRPEESIEALAEVYKIIYETTKALKPNSVVQICPCGTPITFSLIPYMDQAVTADPTSSAQIRQRIKFYKALLGPQTAVFADHVELSDNGIDFASEIGPGGIPSTKFIWPPNKEVFNRVKELWGLTNEKKDIIKSWLDIYRKYRLSEGEFLNLYDLAFDIPEGYVIRKKNCLYYAFFTSHLNQDYEGNITLRGLEQKSYRIYDYARRQNLGIVDGPIAQIWVKFKGYLLLEASTEI
jgi:alpha-galactosidase